MGTLNNEQQYQTDVHQSMFQSKDRLNPPPDLPHPLMKSREQKTSHKLTNISFVTILEEDWHHLTRLDINLHLDHRHSRLILNIPIPPDTSHILRTYMKSIHTRKTATINELQLSKGYHNTHERSSGSVYENCNKLRIQFSSIFSVYNTDPKTRAPHFGHSLQHIS